MEHQNPDQGIPQPEGGEDFQWMDEFLNYDGGIKPLETPVEQNTAPASAVPTLSYEPNPTSTLSYDPITAPAQTYNANESPMCGNQPDASAFMPQLSAQQAYPDLGQAVPDYGGFQPAHIPTSGAGPFGLPRSSVPPKPNSGYKSAQWYYENMKEQASLPGLGQVSAPGGIANFSPQSAAHVSPQFTASLSPRNITSFSSYGTGNAQLLGQQPPPPVTQPGQFKLEFTPDGDWGLNLNEPPQSYLSPPEVKAGDQEVPEKGPKSKTGTYLGFASNQAHAKQLFAQYLARNNTAPGSLQGFPQDDAGQRQLVRQAVEAMVQLEGSHEAQEVAVGTGRKNTAYSRILEHHWTDEALELMAWQVLEACRDAQMGHCRIPDWFGDKRLSSPSTYRTFTDRWDAVIKQLRVSKKTVNALFDTPFINRVAWNIAGESKRKEMNKQGNEKKGDLLRSTKRARSHAAEQKHEEDDEEMQESKPRRRRN
ncbi:hypothetical protein SLS62_003496 [Diatrype stigma]|uniref:Uncharacterized protein n=1 Tax=Diatrype stigma TaxID=117547 RepID=A0AAN9YRB1_9PEZI